jgi:hypothetical protein
MKPMTGRVCEERNAGPLSLIRWNAAFCRAASESSRTGVAANADRSRQRLRGPAPHPGVRAEQSAWQIDLALGIKRRRGLFCRACLEWITEESEGVSVEGRSVHRRINPAGVEFEFRCFRRAPGARVAGTPTTEHSWFPGFAWSFALCGGCGIHLGWFFNGWAPPFYGLILGRLTGEGPRGERS